VCVSVYVYLWGALSLSDYVVEVVRGVCVQTAGQVPRFADPVVVQSSEIIIDTLYTTNNNRLHELDI